MDGSNMYGYNTYMAPKSGLCTASLVLGIVSFFLNPLYMVSIVGIILGIVGVVQKPTPYNQSQGGWGIGLSVAGGIFQITIDTIFTVCTFGIGAFSIFC